MVRALGLPTAALRVVLAVICGLLTYTAFPPMGLWWAAFVGVGGLMALVRGRSLGGGLALGLVYGAGLFTPLLHFTAVAMGNPIGWAALVTLQSLYLAALGSAWALVSRLPALEDREQQGAAPSSSARGSGTGAVKGRRIHPGLARIGAFAILWSGVEELRSSWPLGGFPFGRLAFAMADAPMLPLAAYGGSIGLSLITALIAACLAEAAWCLRRARAFPAIVSATAAGALLLAPIILPVDTRTQEGTIRVGAIQGNVAKDFENAYGRALEVTGNHTEATRRLLAEPGTGRLDMVIWPENAADLDPRTHRATARLVEQAAQEAGAPVLVGAVAVEGQVRYNDMLIWSPDQGAGEYYRKHRPVPFAEYIPARDLVRRLTTQVDRIGIDMAPGHGPYALTVPAAAQDRNVTLAMGICFEVAYDDALRAGVRQGGQAIVIPTNNASFLDSGEAAQQLAQGRVQAVVHGRSVIQVSTVGYTAIINPKGAVLQVTEPYTQDGIAADVGLRSSVTVADRLGPWPGLMAESLAGALVLAGIVGAVRRWRAARTTRRTRS